MKQSLAKSERQLVPTFHFCTEQEDAELQVLDPSDFFHHLEELLCKDHSLASAPSVRRAQPYSNLFPRFPA
jgi:hypothetical protein